MKTEDIINTFTDLLTKVNPEFALIIVCCSVIICTWGIFRSIKKFFFETSIKDDEIKSLKIQIEEKEKVIEEKEKRIIIKAEVNQLTAEKFILEKGKELIQEHKLNELLNNKIQEIEPELKKDLIEQYELINKKFMQQMIWVGMFSTKHFGVLIAENLERVKLIHKKEDFINELELNEKKQGFERPNSIIQITHIQQPSDRYITTIEDLKVSLDTFEKG